MVKICALFCLWSLLSPIALADDTASINAVRKSILALDSAREMTLKNLSHHGQENSLEADYRDFIAFLNTRIYQQCEHLLLQGAADLVQELPCPSVAPSGATINLPGAPAGTESEEAGGEAVPVLTRAEKTRALEQALQKSLGKFDEMLVREEARSSERVPSKREQAGQTGPTGASGAEFSGAKGLSESYMPEEAGSGISASKESTMAGTDNLNTRGSGTGAGLTHPRQEGVRGGVLPPLEDEDIVARQLREAAEKEPDPELKEKLWEEYWRYKGVKR